MIGRRATVGLSLLCALLLSAIAVQSALATAGTNTTAFTCTKVVDNGSFSDAHCDKTVPTPTGYEHEVIPLNQTTEIESTNQTTGGAISTHVFEGSPFKVATRIECTTLTGEGWIENSEPSPKVHKITGTTSIVYSGCTVVKPAKCTTKEIIMQIGSVETQEGLTGPKGEANAMGIELKAPAGKPLATITLEGAECALKNQPFPVEGSFIATNGPGTAEVQTNKHSGATKVVTKEASMSKLTAATRPATLEGITTYRMKNATKAAITTTTVT
jgi:hypothetical protein